ncbi:redoxin domain-containing protein [Janthinobacterium sp. RA13]|uniref:redoxin domain-containing protein n=1 Tax=Janthinobacterium sp. RA13 TaxID=1502762 RepID=UPI00055B3A72|nr:redoxin domain-containing protein [Janthinobacterium sp. RA13]
MDSTTLQLVLAALAFALAGNIWLTLAVLRASRRERIAPAALVPGEPLPAVQARPLAGGARFQPGASGQAAVLLFLASRCPKCGEKLAGIEQLLPLAREAGLALWLISEEPGRRLRAFLPGNALRAATARLTLRDYRRVNPLMSSPSYVFVNHEGTVEAAGLIGDEDWLALVEQLAGDTAQERAA